MKKALLVFLCFFVIQKSFSQTENTPGPAETKLTDTLCKMLSKVDMATIKTSNQARNYWEDCLFLRAPQLIEDVAVERKIEWENKAVHKLDLEIQADLIKQRCDAFLKLYAKFADNDNEEAEGSWGVSMGTFRRIDLNGFNYLIIIGKDNSEKSFLWLEQFEGSEKLMNDTNKIIGKKLKVYWSEIEVYVPDVKKYQKVKEIIEMDIL